MTEKKKRRCGKMSETKAEKRGLFSFFLFRKTPDKKPVLFWFWNFFFITAASVATGAVSLMLAYGNYPFAIFKGYFKVPLIAVLNILPVLVLTYLLYFITGRSWIAHLVVSGIVVASSVGDYYKLRFRDDPFIAADIPSITTGLKVSGNYEITVGVRVIIAFAFVLLSTLFLAFFVRGRIRFRFRTIGIVAALLAAWPVTLWCLDGDTFDGIENFNYEGANRWSDTQKQITRGFVYPFIHSIPDAIPQKPAGYSDAKAKELLSGYESEDIPADKKVNIIGIQLEAYNDFERLGVEGIADTVYEGWRALEKESLTGTLVTNIFAGGTIDTERCFLTGLAALDNFRAPVGSYVRYFSSQGYSTEGGHPSYDWFYNRKNINAYIGFEEYYFTENRYKEMTGKDIGMDDVMIPDILRMYRERDRSKPYFNFSVTYQGHGPYADDNLFAWGDGFWDGEGVSDASRIILNNYFGSIADTTERVSWLIDELRSDPDPVVVVLYGDHNPWLGNGNSVYADLGVDLDVSGERGFYNYFSTRYLIWANDAAKDALGVDPKGEGPTVSACFLMNVLFDECGLGRGSAYMQFTSDFMEKSPVVNTTGFYLENGTIVTEPSEDLSAALRDFSIVEYYRKHHVD